MATASMRRTPGCGDCLIHVIIIACDHERELSNLGLHVLVVVEEAPKVIDVHLDQDLADGLHVIGLKLRNCVVERATDDRLVVLNLLL